MEMGGLMVWGSSSSSSSRSRSPYRGSFFNSRPVKIRHKECASALIAHGGRTRASVIRSEILDLPDDCERSILLRHLWGGK